MKKDNRHNNDLSRREYDFGPANCTGDFTCPDTRKIFDELIKEAFPEGIEAFQKYIQEAGV